MDTRAVIFRKHFWKASEHAIFKNIWRTIRAEMYTPVIEFNAFPKSKNKEMELITKNKKKTKERPIKMKVPPGCFFAKALEV